MGTDQVLVLVNGKRRHTSAYGKYQRKVWQGKHTGRYECHSVAETERIEVLRDGAAAQYGSDAIAGVINIVLKKNSPLTISSAYGQSASNTLGRNCNDGKTFQFDLSKGFTLGEKGSINFGGQFLYRGATDRQGPDTRPLLYSTAPTKGAMEIETEFENRYAELKAADDATANAEGLDRNTMRVGNSQATNAGFFINGEYALSPKANVYLATGLTNKKGEAAGFYRLPFQTSQVDLTLYPNGFLPLINTNITDFSTIAGVRGSFGKWNYDVRNMYGQNFITFDIKKSPNACCRKEPS